MPITSLTEKDLLRTELLQPNPKRNNGIKVKGSLTFSGKFEAEGTYKDDAPIPSIFLRVLLILVLFFRIASLPLRNELFKEHPL